MLQGNERLVNWMTLTKSTFWPVEKSWSHGMATSGFFLQCLQLVVENTGVCLQWQCLTTTFIAFLITLKCYRVGRLESITNVFQNKHLIIISITFQNVPLKYLPVFTTKSLLHCTLTVYNLAENQQLKRMNKFHCTCAESRTLFPDYSRVTRLLGRRRSKNQRWRRAMNVMPAKILSQFCQYWMLLATCSLWHAIGILWVNSLITVDS